jgi:hypothetical protein
MLKKKPYLVKLLSNGEEAKAKMDNFFCEDNISILPSYVQDCIGNCDIFEKENDDTHFIVLIDELSMDYIKEKITTVLHIECDIKDATKQFYFEDYPWELPIGQKRAIQESILQNITTDDILEKISVKGIHTITKEEKQRIQ